MSRKPLTDNFLRSLRPSNSRQTYSDPGCPGLSARNSQTRITWSFRYRFGGKQERENLGVYKYHGVGSVEVTLAQARRKASEIRSKIMLGEDPKEDFAPPETPKTIGELFERWLSEEAPKNASRRGQANMLNNLPQTWKRWHPSKLTTGHVRAWHQSRTDAPVHANRCVMTLSSVFNWAKRFDYVERNPCAGVRYNHEAPRERYLDFDEIRALWHVCETWNTIKSWRGANGAWLLQLLLLTGCRLGEILGARWDEVEGTTLVVPPARLKSAKKSKRQIFHRVHLGQTSLAILDGLPSKGTSEWLFPSPYYPEKPLARVQTIKTNVTRASALELAKSKGIAVAAEATREDLCEVFPHWTIHDLRSTFATHCLMAGVPGLYVSLCLGHSVPAVDRFADRVAAVTRRHYVQKDADREGMVNAWSTWDERLQAIVSDEGKLLAFGG